MCIYEIWGPGLDHENLNGKPSDGSRQSAKGFSNLETSKTMSISMYLVLVMLWRDGSLRQHPIISFIDASNRRIDSCGIEVIPFCLADTKDVCLGLKQHAKLIFVVK
jgi:hypothetical protein